MDSEESKTIQLPGLQVGIPIAKRMPNSDVLRISLNEMDCRSKIRFISLCEGSDSPELHRMKSIITNNAIRIIHLEAPKIKSTDPEFRKLIIRMMCCYTYSGMVQLNDVILREPERFSDSTAVLRLITIIGKSIDSDNDFSEISVDDLVKKMEREEWWDTQQAFMISLMKLIKDGLKKNMVTDLIDTVFKISGSAGALSIQN